MSTAFDRSIFDEPNSADGGSSAGKFKVAPTFVIDISISFLYVLAVVPTWRASIDQTSLGVNLASFVLGLAIVGCYLAKVLVIRHLDGRGGDARAYVKSSALVTTGPYGWSRHPTYVVAMVQFLLWSALAFLLQAFMPWNPIMLAAAVVLPLAFFVINDRIVMPTEEAMLRRLHPEEFDAYAARVRRWFGRRG